MSARRRAGEPEVPARPAGAPEVPAGPAGTPEEDSVPQQARRDEEHPATPPEAEEAARIEADLDQLLADVRRERDEYLELAQRTKADFENYRRRAARDTVEAERRGRSGVVRDLVPVLDNLERALRAAGIDPDATEAEGESSQSPEAEASDDGGGLAHGVLLVYRDLRGGLERAGVESYDPAGERFDPAWHEALATRPEEGTDPGIVLETVEKGYRLDGQVIRAARVIVSE